MKTFVLAALLLLFPASALAAGAVLDSARLSKDARVTLQTQIREARKTDPWTFDAFERLRQKVPELDARKRGRLVPLTGPLRALGPDALLPMLEALAVVSPGQGDWTASAWRAWRVGLLETVGALRDPRARPVLEAIVRSEVDDPHVARAGALALAMFGDEEAAGVLLAELNRERPHKAELVEGMGACRTAGAILALSSLLDTADPALAPAAIRALGTAGNAWAWETLPAEAHADAPKLRAIAAEALLGAFVKFDGRLRESAGKELLVIASPETPKHIAQAKAGASPQLAAELDALAVRFERVLRESERR